MILTTPDQAAEALLFLNSVQEVAYDIETDGLNTRRNNIIGFGFGTEHKQYYVAHLVWNGTQLEEAMPFETCLQIIRALQNKRLIAWNASFDLRFTANYFKTSILDALYSDAMLAFHTTNEDGVSYSQRPFGLKEVAHRYLGADSTAEQAEMKASIKANGGTVHEFYKADLSILAKYCMKDCAMTMKLQRMFHSRMVKEGTDRFFYQDEVMPLLRLVTIPMEAKGIPVDVNALETTKAELTEDLKRLESLILARISPFLSNFEKWFLNKDYPPTLVGPFFQKVLEHFEVDLPRTETGRFSTAAKHLEKLGTDHPINMLLSGRTKLEPSLVMELQRKMHGPVPMFNLLSKHHLKKLFFDELKEEPLSRTPTGAPQVDDDFLQSVASKYEWVPMLQDYNKLTKLLGTYVERILTAQENGIWYPSFFQHRTVSGRYGSDAQQLPRKKEDGTVSEIVKKYNNKIRDFFIAGDEHKLIGADYESLEPHVFAHTSGDERIKNIFRKGHDFYSTIAIMTESLEGVSADKTAPNYLGTVQKDKRQRSKAYALGLAYGMTGYKLQFELNCPQDEAELLARKYFNAFPDLANWIEMSHNEVKANGFVRTEAGRIRHMPRAKEIYLKYGDSILDSLELWKKYNENPEVYEQMKKLRREYKNLVNNSCNVKVQGLSASIVNRACITFAERAKNLNMSAYICLQVHDEVVVRAPNREVALAAQILQDSMENSYKISVPLTAEPQIAQVYGDTK